MFRKQHLVNIFATVATDSADDHAVILLVPFQYGPWPDTEFLANLGRHGDLALCGDP
jgi:hypothetical protein